MWRKFDGSTAPFLCPPKYYEEYYKSLITENTKYWVDDDIINSLIFDFVNGEFDFSEQFLQTVNYKYLQYSLRQKYLLQTAHIKLCNYETMDSAPMKQMIEDGMSLVDDMKSIWFYTSQNFKSYGFSSKTFEVCGKTKSKSYCDGKLRPIYVKIKLKIEATDDGSNDNDNDDNHDMIINSDNIYSLSFVFADSAESFWENALDDWDCWKKEDVEAFTIKSF